MKLLNATRGHLYGDSVIRWMGILLKEESNADVYRVGGVEFAVILASKTFAEQLKIMDLIVARANEESKPLGVPEPAMDLILIHYKDHSPISPESVLIQMNEAMVRAKNGKGENSRIFDAADLHVAPFTHSRWKAADELDETFTARWISHRAVNNVLLTAKWLDEAREAAYTDAISGLPNMRAALLEMEHALQGFLSSGRPFSILLIDGDNIRAYNNISYAVGDEMIRDLSAVLKSSLRPDDFIARWRSGDEFIVVLPGTNSEGADAVGERCRWAVREKSLLWRFPTSVSIGIATCPAHSDDLDGLISKSEAALKCAKEDGKDRVIIADQK